MVDRPKEDNELYMVNDLGSIPNVAPEQMRQTAQHAAVWCVRHEDNPAQALRETLEMLGILVPPEPEEDDSAQ